VVSEDETYAGLYDFLAATETAEESYRIATGYMQQKLWGKALERLERAIKAGTTDADIFNARGVVLTRLLRHDEAFASFERAESMDASQAGYRLNMAIVRHLQGRRHEAAVLYQQVLEMEPAYEGYLDLGP
jgi:Flp pilus assembly protein TadD